MHNLRQLLDKAKIAGAPITIEYAPVYDEWSIKYYIEPHSDDHFYAYHKDVDNAAYLLLDELRCEGL